jgi:hypothetical protein
MDREKMFRNKMEGNPLQLGVASSKWLRQVHWSGLSSGGKGRILPDR